MNNETQPTAGAMRAADFIHDESASRRGAGEGLIPISELAQIIDRETQADVAALREALEADVMFLEILHARFQAPADGYLRLDIERRLTQARAVLARHANKSS
jgi:hypothetical protein